eukprot:COSAG01_NODE_20375_length_957_cov_2.178322_1_plen_195_part_10
MEGSPCSVDGPPRALTMIAAGAVRRRTGCDASKVLVSSLSEVRPAGQQGLAGRPAAALSPISTIRPAAPPPRARKATQSGRCRRLATQRARPGMPSTGPRRCLARRLSLGWGGGCETPGARGKQSPGHSATAVSSRRAARSGAGWRGLPVRQRQPAGRGRMTSPYAEKALSERAAGTKGAWTQLRSGNLSAGECS